MSGIRSSKTIDGVEHEYLTLDGRVSQESWENNVLQFVYDESGAPYLLRYSDDGGNSWNTFYYLLNLQGDVVKLISADGTLCATYTYNAWGQVTSAETTTDRAVSNLAELNPLRYRGYYYDTETGFYYLQSRYYDPTIKRFLNADAFASTGQGFLGYNMFAYCNNSPVAEKDEHGGLPHTTLELTNPNEVPPIVVLGSDTTGEVQDKQLERRDEGIAVSYDPKKKSVTCSVDFRCFEYTDKNGNPANYFDNWVFKYLVCEAIDREVREMEAYVLSCGLEIEGSMGFDHIYQELTYHYLGYSVFEEGDRFYGSCVVADLNYDESRIICYPMYLIPVPVRLSDFLFEPPILIV